MTHVARRLRGRTALTLSLALSVPLAGCSDQIVYRDREAAFDTPPAAAADFLGYSNADTKRTTCGNCHAGKQLQWQQTKHADAWHTLAASGSASTAGCEGCHTVSSLGNPLVSANVGWAATRSARYQDVQCESCHGPGLKHALNPDAKSNQPLAALAVAADPATTPSDATGGCAECHAGKEQPFAEEWRASRHANLILSRNTNADCVGCHDAKGVLARWNVKSNFAEASNPTAYMTVTCTVCHDPHDATNARQLRKPINVASVDGNLCMQCHQRRAVPDPTSVRGPHSPQGPLLLGAAGWFPPSFDKKPGELIASHGSSRNARLCVTCHVQDYTVKDAAGKTAFRSTGHSFDPIPCVGADGIPTGKSDCTDAQRSFRACVACHGSESSVRSALAVARSRAERLSEEITDLLAKVPAKEFNTTDSKITTAEGARFNRDMARMEGSVVHNPFLVEALLIASIKQMELDYGVKASAALSLRPQLAAR